MKKTIDFMRDHTPPATVVAVALFLGTILLFAGIYAPTPNATAATTTGMSPAVGPACNCVPEDMSKSLMKMEQTVELLANQLRAAETREVDAQAELAEAQAEIERLKAEKAILHETIGRIGEAIPNLYDSQSPKDEEDQLLGLPGTL